MEKRREARYAARIVARVSRRNQMVDLLTNDVSFRGVFVRTNAPPALRQLVKLELVLPSTAPPAGEAPAGERVVVAGHAMVVHVADPVVVDEDAGRAMPGVGLQFWGAMKHAKEWELFIHDLKQRERGGKATAKMTDKIRRVSERFKLALQVSFDGETVMTRDVSETGFAIRTKMAMPIGAHAELTVDGNGESMKLDVIVRRAIDEPGFRGLGVELADTSIESRWELMRFIRRHSPSEDRIIVPAGNPELH